MSKIKDLIIEQQKISFDNDEFILKTNKNTLSENEHKETTLTQEGRGSKKYMKFEDGKVKYLLEEENIANCETENEIKVGDNQNSNFKVISIISSFIKKEKFTKLLKLIEKDFNIKYFINILILVFAIVFILSIYVFFHRGPHYKENIENNNLHTISENLNTEGKTNNVTEIEEDKIEDDKKIADERIQLENVISEVKRINSEEINKVYDYIDLKANRASTKSAINRYKASKENLYLLINKDKNIKIENDKLFQETEALLIKSIAMSNELLDVFNGKATKTKLDDVISRYCN